MPPRFDLPTPDLETEPFWAGVNDDKLLIKHCNACGEYHFYPRPFCPKCWSDDVDWQPRVQMAMSSAIANRYFHGRENVAIAIARRRIRAGGDVRAALSIIPITKPIYARYRDMVAADYPHLTV